MKHYICRNFGSCGNADTGTAFELRDGDDPECPECRSTTIREVERNTGPRVGNRTTRIIALISAVLLLGVFMWWLLSPDPLKVEVANFDCKTGKLTLSTSDGNGDPILFRADGLSNGQNEPVFNVPTNYSRTKPLILYAVQGGTTYTVEYKVPCPEPPNPPGGPNKGTENIPHPRAGTLVEGSGECRDCEYFYQVYNKQGGKSWLSKGYTTGCCKCGSTVQFSDGLTYDIVCDGDRILAKMVTATRANSSE